jgi:outer membrane protein TolC
MQELALWKAETMTLEAAYQDAIREYRTLTGMERIPADISEPLSEREVIGDDHPALQMAMHELAAVDASAEVAQQTGTVRPSVQLFWRGYRGDRAAPDVNALGLGVAIPLGRSPSRGPQIARANEDLARAHARLTELRRMLDLNLHEARHQLHTSRRQLENSTAMVEAAAERHRLDQLAFELGEFSLREWLRRLSETRKIQQSHELLLMQQGAAIASYNQAVGETP